MVVRLVVPVVEMVAAETAGLVAGMIVPAAAGTAVGAVDTVVAVPVDIAVANSEIVAAAGAGVAGKIVVCIDRRFADCRQHHLRCADLSPGRLDSIRCRDYILL